jgi:hypothetical protein
MKVKLDIFLYVCVCVCVKNNKSRNFIILFSIYIYPLLCSYISIILGDI